MSAVGVESKHVNSLDPLILDFLEWIGPQIRPYADVMDAWHTSCPRLTVWEDANERGFVERRHDGVRGPVVAVTAEGLEFLERHRRSRDQSGE
jgi:hypothetical protein